MEERELHPNLKVVKQLVEGLKDMMGSRYEVILHDLSQVESSIVALEGSVTDRHLGGPVTNYVLQLIRKYGKDVPNSINYKNVLSDGRLLRSSTIFIRDDDGEVVGCLCINQDLTDYLVVVNLFKELTSFNTLEDEPEAGMEFFARDISEVMETIVSSELKLMAKPVAYMQKEDKLAIVDRLEDKGIFDVKGSVEYVAERLGVTNFTIYNYLKEVRFCRSR